MSHQDTTDGARPPEADPLLSRPTQPVDIENLYLLALGREPENRSAVDDKVDASRGKLIRQFFLSDEFLDHVVRPVTEGRLPLGQFFDEAPRSAMTAWAADFLPLSVVARSRLSRAQTWINVYEAVFSDTEFTRALPELQQFCFPSRFQERLKILNGVLEERAPLGELQEASGLVVRGWAFDRRDAQKSIGVELWVDGAFVAATVANEYRRDLQERFSSSGAYGYTFEGFSPPDPASERPIRVEIRDSASKILLGAKTIVWRPDHEAARFADLSQQIISVREALETVESTLHKITSAFGFTLSNYDKYRRAFYIDTPALQEKLLKQAAAFEKQTEFTILIIAPPRTEGELLVTLGSLRSQTYRSFDVIIIGTGHDAARASETALAPAVVSLEFPEVISSDYVIVVDAGDQLTSDALHRFASNIQSKEPVFIYSDSDQIKIGNGRVRFENPVLRPGFDPDLLLQIPYIGNLAAIEAKWLIQFVSTKDELHRNRRGSLYLKLLDGCSKDQVIHIPRVLYHLDEQVTDESASDYSDEVAAALERQGLDATVVRQPDVVGAQFSSSRILWPLRTGLKAAVIIPTRDRLDLLGPCLASLLAAKPQNSVEVEIVVVDNASASATTQRFLNTLDLAGRIRLIAYDAPFNWSAINNHAARGVDADVLIFLNNDTVALTQDWSDELCRQALRPEIGAVGPRLLYEDGTIQHAGIVFNNGQIVHEGAGAPATDGGYLGRRLQVHQCAAVTGACMATRAELFKSLGGFDEDRLAVEANDIDYCLRVRNAGFAVLYDPFCTLYHFESQSRGHTGLDRDRQRRADGELSSLRRRWGANLGGDPYYNGHFDRESRPFTRLGPPPLL